MRIEMSREIRVKAYEVVAKLAFPEDRTEVLSLLQMANHLGSLSASDIVDRRSGLLPGRPKVMGFRLLNMLVDLGLLENFHSKEFTLTEYGSEALENETIFIPEESSWKIWVTEDPLFPSHILHVERHMEGFAPKGSRAGVKQMPDFITDIEGANIKLIRTHHTDCLLYTSPSPRDRSLSRMPSSA